MREYKAEAAAGGRSVPRLNEGRAKLLQEFFVAIKLKTAFMLGFLCEAQDLIEPDKFGASVFRWRLNAILRKSRRCGQEGGGQ